MYLIIIVFDLPSLMFLNTQMPSNELAKVLIFILIQATLCFAGGLGLLPALALLIGYFLSLRNQEAIFLIKAIKATKIYIYILLILLFINEIVVLLEGDLDRVLTTFSVMLILIFYLISLNKLFTTPMLKYFTQIATHGLFLRKVKSEKNIYKGADELLKLNKLKEKGIISEQEFLRMKEKVMK